MRQSQGLQASASSDAEDSRFSETQWNKLFAARLAGSTEQCSILDSLIRRYWKPVYCYLRRSGCGEEEAKDLVQAFFHACLQNGFFAKADPKFGRFRNFLLSSLKHFVANARRAALAKKRHPSKGFAFVDDTTFQQENPGALHDTITPDEIFHRTWLQELILRVLKRLEHHCRESGKGLHYRLFHRYVAEPALDGTEAPKLRDLGAAHGLSGKDAANRVVTVQRAFVRLLHEEIRVYAASESEVAAEVQDLQSFLLR